MRWSREQAEQIALELQCCLLRRRPVFPTISHFNANIEGIWCKFHTFSRIFPFKSPGLRRIYRALIGGMTGGATLTTGCC